MTIPAPKVIEVEKLAGELATWTEIYTATDNDYSDTIIIRNTLLTRIVIRYDQTEEPNQFMTVNAGEKFIIDGIKFWKQGGRIIEAMIAAVEVDESLRINLV
jgi:hypothetical protein